MSRNLGTLTSWNSLGHSRPVTGLLYLTLWTVLKFELRHGVGLSYRSLRQEGLCTSDTTVCCCVCCIVEGGMFRPCLLPMFRSFPYQGTCRGSLHLKSSTKITYGFDDVVLNAVTMSLFRRVWKIAKRDYCFVMSVCLHGAARLPLDGFSWNLIFENFSKTCLEDLFLLKSDSSNGYLTWRLTYFFFYHISLICS